VTGDIGLNVVIAFQRLSAAASTTLQNAGDTRRNVLALIFISVLGVILHTGAHTTASQGHMRDRGAAARPHALLLPPLLPPALVIEIVQCTIESHRILDNHWNWR